MELRIVKIEDDILIGGLSVESTGEEKDNNQKRELLFNDFIHNGQNELLSGIAKNNNEYYIVAWLTSPTIKYLLGQKVSEKIDGLEFKTIKKGEYATKKIPPKYDSYSAWVEFYENNKKKSYAFLRVRRTRMKNNPNDVTSLLTELMERISAADTARHTAHNFRRHRANPFFR